MHTPFSLTRYRTTEAQRDSGDSGDASEYARGVDSVKETVTLAVREFGITRRTHTSPWFCSGYPKEDREYFEEGVEKHYTLHFPLLSPRALRRVDQMIALLYGRTPDAL